METHWIDDTCTYQIAVRGRIDAGDLNAMSPLALDDVRVEAADTVFTVHTDQSGLVGLLRYLHARRLVFLSVSIPVSLQTVEEK